MENTAKLCQLIDTWRNSVKCILRPAALSERGRQPPWYSSCVAMPSGHKGLPVCPPDANNVQASQTQVG